MENKQRKIILDKGQSPGDILVFTCALRDLKKAHPDWLIDVRSCVPEIFENSPHITKLKESEAEYVDVSYPDIQNSGKSGRHFSRAYHIFLEEKLKTKIPQTTIYPEVHLTDKEKAWTSQVAEIGTAPVTEQTGYRGPFWLINAGHKLDFPLKQWGFDKWQKLVDILADRVQFVQIGEHHRDHKHPKLNGVIDFTGQTSIRQLIRLAYHAVGSVCHVTFLMHLMAAYQKPCVVVAGGREPRRWEMYPNHRYIDTCGCLPCCEMDGCWNSGHVHWEEPNTPNKQCSNMTGGQPKCMQMITPEMVAEQILMYYHGGVVS